MRLAKVIKNVVLAFLFLGALYTTIHAISGLDAHDFMHWLSTTGQSHPKELKMKSFHDIYLIIIKSLQGRVKVKKPIYLCRYRI